MNGIQSDVGHAGAHTRLHDAARQRGGDAGERAPECGSISRRAVRHLRQPGQPHGRRPHGARPQRDARPRAAAHTSTSSTRSDPIGAILDYARTQGITQLFVGHNLRRSWMSELTGTLLDRLIGEADGIDVRVFPH